MGDACCTGLSALPLRHELCHHPEILHDHSELAVALAGDTQRYRKWSIAATSLESTG